MTMINSFEVLKNSSKSSSTKGGTLNLKVYIFTIVECDESSSIFSFILTICSLLLVVATLPVSLLYTVKVVQVITGRLNVLGLE